MSTSSLIWATVQAEFSDLPDVAAFTRATLRMLVALGSALFVLVPAQAGMTPEDLSRVVQGMVSGIGFLGAGAVLKSSGEGRIPGLTTAASIWATAAVGMAAGLGREGTALLATAFVLRVLAALRRVSRRIRHRRPVAAS